MRRRRPARRRHNLPLPLQEAQPQPRRPTLQGQLGHDSRCTRTTYPVHHANISATRALSDTAGGLVWNAKGGSMRDDAVGGLHRKGANADGTGRGAIGFCLTNVGGSSFWKMWLLDLQSIWNQGAEQIAKRPRGISAHQLGAGGRAGQLIAVAMIVLATRLARWTEAALRFGGDRAGCVPSVVPSKFAAQQMTIHVPHVSVTSGTGVREMAIPGACPEARRARKGPMTCLSKLEGYPTGALGLLVVNCFEPASMQVWGSQH